MEEKVLNWTTENRLFYNKNRFHSRFVYKVVKKYKQEGEFDSTRLPPAPAMHFRVILNAFMYYNEGMLRKTIQIRGGSSQQL